MKTMKKNGSRMLIVLGFIMFFFVMVIPESTACPTCSDIMNRGVDAFKAMKFGQGIAWSILLMFSMPLLLIGGIAGLIVRERNRNLKRAPQKDEG